MEVWKLQTVYATMHARAVIISFIQDGNIGTRNVHIVAVMRYKGQKTGVN